ncbi:ATP-grasp domain-containing protein [Vibrio lentus]|uniref:ATP-grasp domain-containing protein n=1 Tax=Vibrio lentus TaxID=136468 RepID=UPI000C84B666|nr:ATP-grasp domain-containing protein [Vibrio lentus]PMI80190.1 hypothetical protein BCU36_17085 [Vibrio lentus]
MNILLIEPISIHSIERYLETFESEKWHATLVTVPGSKFDGYHDRFDDVIRISSLDCLPEEVIKHIRPNSFTSVVPGSEFSVPLSEMIAKEIGTPSNKNCNIELFRNKELMRVFFKSNSLPQPRLYASVNSLEEAEQTLEKNNFPVVVKPVDMAGSANVKICHDKAEALDTVERILGYSKSRVTEIGFLQTALIEQAVIGPEFSAEVIIESSEIRHISITKKFLGPYPSCDEVGHLVGSKLPEGLSEKLKFIVASIIKNSGYGLGVIHLEFKFVNDDVYLIEIGSRVPGDYISTLLELKYGLNVEKCFCKLRGGIKLSSTDLGNNQLTSGDSENIYGVKFFFDTPFTLPDQVTLVDMKVSSVERSKGYGVSDRSGHLIFKADRSMQDELNYMLNIN